MSAVGRGLDALGYDEHGAYRPELDTQRDAPGPSRRARADRYAGRVLDVPALLAQPDEPIPWRCHNLAADGFLTVLAGAGGEGKSWLALALACGVARGESAAGIKCAKGRALIFDAENGPKLTIRRFRTAGVRDLAVQPVDAGGLLILRDLNWFKQTIEEQRAHLVVFDSLRVLSSGAKENDSDVMEPIITALKQIARDTGAAVLLVHHRGKSEESDYRGTSAIRDQTDLIFRLQRVKGDPDGRTRRKITTVKCRIEEEPEPRWVQIVADRARGLVSVDEAEPYEEEHARPRDTHQEDVLDALGGIARSERSITKAAGLARTTVQRILADLEAEGLAERTPDGWVAHPGVAHGGGPPGPPPANGSSKPNVGGPLRVGHLGQWATLNGHDPGGETPLKEPTCANPEHRPADWRMPNARMWICGECHPPGMNAGVAVWRNGAGA
jgi:archaellum biogenesis ATPase FlaH